MKTTKSLREKVTIRCKNTQKDRGVCRAAGWLASKIWRRETHSILRRWL